MDWQNGKHWSWCARQKFRYFLRAALYTCLVDVAKASFVNFFISVFKSSRHLEEPVWGLCLPWGVGLETFGPVNERVHLL